jgi:hypothetical protein
VQPEQARPRLWWLWRALALVGSFAGIWAVLWVAFYGLLSYLTAANCGGFAEGLRPVTSYHLYCTAPPHTSEQAWYISRLLTVGLVIAYVTFRALKRWRARADMANAVFLAATALVTLWAVVLIARLLIIIFTAHRPG